MPIFESKEEKKRKRLAEIEKKVTEANKPPSAATRLLVDQRRAKAGKVSGFQIGAAWKTALAEEKSNKQKKTKPPTKKKNG